MKTTSESVALCRPFCQRQVHSGLFIMLPMKTNRAVKFQAVCPYVPAEECFSITSLPGR
jgi:hypothetical protein